MKNLNSFKITWLTLMLISLVFIGCGGGGDGGGGVIQAGNNAPVLNPIGAQVVAEGTPLSFMVTASDPDGDPITLSASGLTTGMTFDTGTGAFAFTPAVGSVGVDPIVTFEASDGSLSDSEDVSFKVAFLASAAPESEAMGTSGGNDTTATADMLLDGFSATGDLSLAGDVDVWSFSATGGMVIEIALFGTRLDQLGWGMGGTVPSLSLIDTDGTTILLEHDQAEFSGVPPGTPPIWGPHDMDIPRFHVPATGDYFLSISQDDPLVQGGSYAVKISEVMLSNMQFEAEASGTSGANDSAASAEPIQTGTMVGYHTDLASDYYSFNVAATSIVCFEVTAYRNGMLNQNIEYTDLELSLYDAGGATLLSNSDDGFFFDPSLCYGIETPGDYAVEVTNFFGSGSGEYYLDFNMQASGPGAGTGVIEIEPNNVALDATGIAYGLTGSGNVEAGIGGDEADVFVFPATAGDVVRVQQFDVMNSQGATDSIEIAILGPNGVIPLADDFNGPAGLQVTRTILQETGNHFVRVRSTGTVGITSYRFSLDVHKMAGYEIEPNDTMATAIPLDMGGRAAGAIDVIDDEDFYSFSANQDEVVTLAIHAAAADSDGFGDLSGHGSMLEPVLTIQDASGTILSETTFDLITALVTGESITDGLASLGTTFIAPATGTYTVTVAESRISSASADHYYVIERK